MTGIEFIVIGVAVGATVGAATVVGMSQVGLLVRDVGAIVDRITELNIPLEDYCEDNFLISEAFVLLWHEKDGVDFGLPIHKVRTACLVAYFLDLIALKRLSIEKTKKGVIKFSVISREPLNNHLDSLFEKLIKVEKDKQSLKKWILKEHFNNEYVDFVIAQLCKKLILHEEKTKRFGFTRTIHTLADSDRKDALRKKMRNISYNFRQGNGNSLALLALFYETDSLHSSLLPKLFEPEEMENARENLKQLVSVKEKTPEEKEEEERFEKEEKERMKLEKKEQRLKDSQDKKDKEEQRKKEKQEKEQQKKEEKAAAEQLKKEQKTALELKKKEDKLERFSTDTSSFSQTSNKSSPRNLNPWGDPRKHQSMTGELVSTEEKPDEERTIISTV